MDELASSVKVGESLATLDWNPSSSTVSDMLKSKSSRRSNSSGESFSSSCNREREQFLGDISTLDSGGL